jgi:hypothetical protein
MLIKLKKSNKKKITNYAAKELNLEDIVVCEVRRANCSVIFGSSSEPCWITRLNQVVVYNSLC